MATVRTRAGVRDAPRGPGTLMACFGTRPEVIKLAPVIERLREDTDLTVVTVTTAQHREMLDQTLQTFDLEPDVDLALMRPEQDLALLASRALGALAKTLGAHRPDAVLVQGDTTTTLSAAYAAFCARVPVGHVEAGLRTYDPERPFPEEVNRRLVSALARWNFCPTESAARNLRGEAVAESTIQVTGNTVVDALHAVCSRLGDAVPPGIPPKAADRRILVTLHRRETQGEPQRRLCAMLAGLAERDDVEIVFPVHLSPAVRRTVLAELQGLANVHLIDPVDYLGFVALMRSSDVIVTDSGGVQEEAPSLDVPVVLMRDATERPEGVDAGCTLLSGTDPGAVRRDIELLLDDPAERARIAAVPNPYGDGRAAERIAARLERDLHGTVIRELGPARRGAGG